MPKSETTITTRRLKLRPLAASDAQDIATLAGDWAVASMTDRIPYPYTKEDAEHWMATIPANETVFAITLSHQLIGVCSVMCQTEKEGEIGYWIGKPWWGQGFATEAAEALIKFCFRKLKLTEVSCCHFVDNPASKRVIEKLGFASAGRRQAWSDARRRESSAICYKLQRPRLAFLWRRAA